MKYLVVITLVLFTISFLKDRQKTRQALKIGIKKLINISIMMLIILIPVSVVLYFVNGSLISRYLSNDNQWPAVLIASLLGSITIMPGFIAFPLSGILKQNGVSFMVISAFTTTLMMVGILTFPVEKKYFGLKVAVMRNIISFMIAIAVAIATGFFFGELF